ncbi:MAG: hypothetical protein ACO1NY_13340 [Pseudorhodoplanes sp.]
MDTERRAARSFRLGDIAIAAAIVIGIPALLLYNGFGVCAQPRNGGFPHYKIDFLSDEEAIEAAIQAAINLPSHIVETPTGGYALFAPKNQTRYRDREEFRQLNPDCCNIVPHDRSSIILSRWHEIFGRAAKSVRVTYSVRYIDEDGKRSQGTAVMQGVISNCSNVLN